MILEIKHLSDVSTFMLQLIEEGVNAHPDEDFSQYVNINTGEATYTETEATLRNSLMAQCFDVCDKSGEDIYTIMQDIYLAETGLDKLIPKSTDLF